MEQVVQNSLSFPSGVYLHGTWFNRLHKLRLHALDILIRHQFLDDRLRIVLIKCLLPVIPLKEVKNGWILVISGKTVVNRAGFELRQTSRLRVDSFESVRVLCVGMNSTEDAEFILRDGWKFS